MNLDQRSDLKWAMQAALLEQSRIVTESKQVSQFILKEATYEQMLNLCFNPRHKTTYHDSEVLESVAVTVISDLVNPPSTWDMFNVVESVLGEAQGGGTAKRFAATAREAGKRAQKAAKGPGYVSKAGQLAAKTAESDNLENWEFDRFIAGRKAAGSYGGSAATSAGSVPRVTQNLPSRPSSGPTITPTPGQFVGPRRQPPPLPNAAQGVAGKAADAAQSKGSGFAGKAADTLWRKRTGAGKVGVVAGTAVAATATAAGLYYLYKRFKNSGKTDSQAAQLVAAKAEDPEKKQEWQAKAAKLKASGK